MFFIFFPWHKESYVLCQGTTSLVILRLFKIRLYYSTARHVGEVDIALLILMFPLNEETHFVLHIRKRKLSVN